MDCIGWQSKGRFWVLQFCGSNREQDPMEGKQTIPRKSQSNGILMRRKLQGASSSLLHGTLYRILWHQTKARLNTILLCQQHISWTHTMATTMHSKQSQQTARTKL
eukprot:14709372-Ditylum_brightwellii.AAC.1